MQQKKAAPFFFIYLLPVFFILNGYNDYFGFFSPSFVLLNLAAVSVSIACVFFVSFKLFQHREKGILFGFGISLFLIFFGSVFDSWKALTKLHFLSGYLFVAPACLLLVYLFFIFLRRYMKPLTQVFTYLNLVFVILILFETARFVVLETKKKPGNLLIDARFSVFNSVKTDNRKADTAKPDIFLLIFDAMPSSKAMQKDLGFSNQLLDTFLQQQGFFVARDAKSNYDLTVLSVSSMLNMEYVSREEVQKGTGINMYYRSTSSLLDNSLVRVLQKEKYHIYQYQPLSIFKNADWNGNLVFGNMLHMNYFYKTFPGRLYRDLAWNFQRIDAFAEEYYMKESIRKKDDILKTDSLIRNVCNRTGPPKFVYAHYMLPHVPFYFNADGTIRSFNRSNKAEVSENVQITDQVQYTNKKITELLNYIKENNKTNTVIIVMGDHGFKSLQKNNDPEFGFQNLNAVYFPDKDYSYLYPSLSPVNTFRIVLNKYFSAKLPLLKDSSVIYEFSGPDWEK